MAIPLRKVNFATLLLKNLLEKSTMINSKMQKLHTRIVTKNLTKKFLASKLAIRLQKL